MRVFVLETESVYILSLWLTITAKYTRNFLICSSVNKLMTTQCLDQLKMWLHWFSSQLTGDKYPWIFKEPRAARTASTKKYNQTPCVYFMKWNQLLRMRSKWRGHLWIYRCVPCKANSWTLYKPYSILHDQLFFLDPVR